MLNRVKVNDKRYQNDKHVLCKLQRYKLQRRNLRKQMQLLDKQYRVNILLFLNLAFISFMYNIFTLLNRTRNICIKYSYVY